MSKYKNDPEQYFKNLINGNENVLHGFFMLPKQKNLTAPKDANKDKKEEVFSFLEKAFSLVDNECSDLLELAKKTFPPCGHSESADFSALNDLRFYRIMAKQEAFLSAYDKVRKMISCLEGNNDDKLISAIYYDKLLAEENSSDENMTEIYGLYALYKKNSAENPATSNNHFIYFKNTENTTSSDVVEKAIHNFKSNSRTLYNKMSETKKSFGDLSDIPNKPFTEDMLFGLRLLELNQLIAGRRIKDNKGYFIAGANSLLTFLEDDKMKNSDQYERFVKNANYLYKHVDLDFKDVDETQENVDKTIENVDKIYCRYIFEKIFPISTADVLYSYIDKDKEDNITLFIKKNLEYVVEITKLPNVFTRDYIVRMLIDSMSLPIISTRLHQTGSGIQFTSNMGSTPETRYLEYLVSYTKLLRLLKTLIFPVYSNYFFSILWNATGGNSIPIQEHAIKLYEFLSIYLNDPDKSKNLLDLREGPFNQESDSIDKLEDVSPLINEIKHTNVNFSTFSKCLSLSFKQGRSEAIYGLPHIPDFLSTSYINKITGINSREILSTSAKEVLNSLQ